MSLHCAATRPDFFNVLFFFFKPCGLSWWHSWEWNITMFSVFPVFSLALWCWLVSIGLRMLTLQEKDVMASWQIAQDGHSHSACWGGAKKRIRQFSNLGNQRIKIWRLTTILSNGHERWALHVKNEINWSLKTQNENFTWFEMTCWAFFVKDAHRKKPRLSYGFMRSY